MAQQKLLTDVISVLRRHQIAFMLTGSHASSLYGEARATHDIDLVVRLVPGDADRLFQEFDSDRFYLSKSAMVDAIRDKKMFNLLELKTAEKVDFWVLTESPFDQSRFERKQSFDLGEQIVDVSSPEDTILMKLVWSKRIGGSEKQISDVSQIYELQADLLDQTYLQTWIAALDLNHEWQTVLSKVKPIIPPEFPPIL